MPRHWLKNDQRPWTDISQKKEYKWLVNPWKEFHSDDKSEKYKLKPRQREFHNHIEKNKKDNSKC